MTALVWDKIEDRDYEAGIDRGVFYPLAEWGEVWNGLISVEEGFVGGESLSKYIDGIKYINGVVDKNFQASVSAFAAPKGFIGQQGRRPIIPGLFLTSQMKLRFNFTYRTGQEDGEYKLHLVYNVLATPLKNVYSTLGQAVSPSILTWRFDATPVKVTGFKPTAHFVVDSKKTPSAKLSVIENYLYGTPVLPPLFPTIATLMTIFNVDP